mmetsp:Transcript_37844/g.84567  ORF Transcript_37844/g.84567 Transcript_37844/m.84567 type:complete len:129 (-) Transcript_37844:285-671(-)
MPPARLEEWGIAEHSTRASFLRLSCVEPAPFLAASAALAPREAALGGSPPGAAPAVATSAASAASRSLVGLVGGMAEVGYALENGGRAEAADPAAYQSLDPPLALFFAPAPEAALEANPGDAPGPRPD